MHKLPRPDRATVRARMGVFGYFFLLGITVGMWSAGLPALNERLDLGPARLGTVLLLVAAGALAAMLLAGPLVDRYSSRRVAWFTGPLSAVLVIGPALAPGFLWLAVLAVVFGIGLGTAEVAINSHSVEVERRYGRPIVSAFHGVWSLGGAAGGAMTAAGLQAGLDGQVLLIAAAVVVPFAYLPCARLLGPAVEPPRAAQATLLSGTTRWGIVAVLGVVAFAGHLSEGAAMDWAALHARWVLDADPALAPLAYTIFSVAMTTVRLLGDPLRARLGAARTIRLAGILAACGYALVLAAGAVPAGLSVACAWTGWGLAGVGLATVIPVIFSAVGASGDSVGRALALVTAFGYTGLLAGPAALGFVAESFSLPAALVIPAVFAIVVAVAGGPGIRAILPTAHPAKDAVPAPAADH
ncbi:MFS transporter [Spongiactinospora sp. 9N601]|uniref:MFS transporter n=1 Tax=Spongiactinospora sp. 9N601 TaxID=3375149 RepID=UPI003794953A